MTTIKIKIRERQLTQYVRMKLHIMSIRSVHISKLVVWDKSKPLKIWI